MNDLQQQIQNITSKGRYGDTMLMHVNPIEVEALAQNVPLTINPDTGLPEAFLPILAPILGSMLGPAAFSAIGLGGLSPLLASSLGSALAQTAATGDLKKGVLAGLTGYGLGRVAQGFGKTGIEQEVLGQADQAIASGTQADFVRENILSGDPSLAQYKFTNPEEYAKFLTEESAKQFGSNVANTGIGAPNLQPSRNLANLMRQGNAPQFVGPVQTPTVFTPEMAEKLLTQPFDPVTNPLINQAGKDFIAQTSQPANFSSFVSDVSVPFAQDTVSGFYNTPMNELSESIYKTTGRGFTDAAGNFNLGQGAASAFNTLTQPGTYLPIAGGVGGTAYLDAMNAEPGMTQEEIYDARRAELRELFPEVMPMQAGKKTGLSGVAEYGRGGSIRTAIEEVAEEGIPDLGDDPIELDPNTLRQTLAIPENFRAGFDPEINYFRSLNPSFAALNPTGEKTPMPIMTNTASYIPSVLTAPMVIDPYKAIRPEDLQPMKEGKQTDLKPIPEGNAGLPKLPESVRNEMGYMAEGRETELTTPEMTMAEAEAISNDPLTQELVGFLLGQSQDSSVVDRFTDKYGSEAFRIVRNRALNAVMPGNQNEGMITGDAAGGMADDIYGTISGKDPVAVSQDEYIVPADVVSMYGDGSSDAGAKKLDEDLNRIRQEKTGTTKQAEPTNQRMLAT